jgi:hypothetical protein
VRSRTIRNAAIVGAGAALIGALFGRSWVFIGLLVGGYVVVTIWTWYEERKLLQELRALPEEEREQVLANDPELAAELRKKL